MDAPFGTDDRRPGGAANRRTGDVRLRFLVVHNARAGLAQHAFLETVLARLAAAKASSLIVELTDSGDVVSRITGEIASGTYDAVVAAGGDGTIRRVLPALDGSALPLGIVPLGTGNVLARELGLPRRAGAVARTLLEGPVRTIKGATANGSPFLLMCGVGLDGRIIASLDQNLKSRIGKFAYSLPLAKALLGRVEALEVVADGREHFAAWAIVTNASRYGGNFVLTRRTHVCEAGLQLVLFKGEGRLELANRLMALSLGWLDHRAERHGDIVILPCRHVTIRARTPVAMQIDGDPAGTTPLVVSAEHGPELSIIVPCREDAT